MHDELADRVDFGPADSDDRLSFCERQRLAGSDGRHLPSPSVSITIAWA
jgi:hypothetical protein